MTGLLQAREYHWCHIWPANVIEILVVSWIVCYFHMNISGAVTGLQCHKNIADFKTSLLLSHRNIGGVISSLLLFREYCWHCHENITGAMTGLLVSQEYCWCHRSAHVTGTVLVPWLISYCHENIADVRPFHDIVIKHRQEGEMSRWPFYRRH